MPTMAPPEEPCIRCLCKASVPELCLGFQMHIAAICSSG